MLATAGIDTDNAVEGMAAASLLGVGGLLALPLFALPAILGGAPVSSGLVHTALLGLVGCDDVRSTLGRNWPLAVALTAGRLGFDYGCLLFALRATGSHPRPSLVLLAYAAAGILAMVPITPGGLGIVDAYVVFRRRYPHARQAVACTGQ